MASRVCGLLVLVCVWCTPSLAQEGGTYVEPKQGDYVEPKQACGGSLVVDNDGETITSPGYPDNYGKRERCTWSITAENPGDTLEVDCSDFSLVYSWLCRGDRVMIYEDGQLMERWCGGRSQYFVSEGDTIEIKFRTNRWRTRKGFSCLVRSVSETTDEEESTTTENPEEATQPTDNSGTCRCGVANPSRIVGGQEVNPTHKYPWQVGLKKRGGSNYYCGGSIINTDYAMTAAHCFFDSQGNRVSDVGLVVGVADHNMYSTDDDVSGVTRLVDVERVILHPDYSPRGSDYDIAVLKLKEKLDLSEHKQLRAVCLPADDSKTYEGVMATASGWGTTQSGGRQPPVLQEVSLPILEPSCWGMRGVTQNMLCAGYREGGKDTCQGDSGGPLYVNENNRYVQVGITSWGYGCASRNSPGVYARVSKFLPWIQSNTADGTYCQ